MSMGSPWRDWFQQTYDDRRWSRSTWIRSGLRGVSWCMPTPELISLIVALIVWIVLLGTLPADV
jgi:hypothetical protein